MISQVSPALLQTVPNQGQQWPQERSTSLLLNSTTCPTYLSKVDKQRSQEKNSTAYLNNHSIFFTYLSSLLGTVEGHYCFFYLQENWGICLAEEGGACFGFFLSYNSFLWPRSSPASSLCWTAQYTVFTKPLLLVTALFWALPSWSTFPPKCCAPELRQ